MSTAEPQLTVDESWAPLLNRYTLGSFLGKGGFGTVWECTDRASGEKCACKVFEKAKLKSKEEEAALRREMVVMTALQGQHRGVVQLREVVQGVEHTWLIMEKCSGGDAFHLLCERGKLPEESARSVFLQLASALQFCHSLGIVHRDVKLENILFNSDPASLYKKQGADSSHASSGSSAQASNVQKTSLVIEESVPLHCNHHLIIAEVNAEGTRVFADEDRTGDEKPPGEGGGQSTVLQCPSGTVQANSGHQDHRPTVLMNNAEQVCGEVPANIARQELPGNVPSYSGRQDDANNFPPHMCLPHTPEKGLLGPIPQSGGSPDILPRGMASGTIVARTDNSFKQVDVSAPGLPNSCQAVHTKLACNKFDAAPGEVLEETRDLRSAAHKGVLSKVPLVGSGLVNGGKDMNEMVLASDKCSGSGIAQALESTEPNDAEVVLGGVSGTLHGSQVMTKLADFGLAVVLDPGQTTRGVVGSRFYMSPEVISGRPYGRRADVWSLGVVLCALLTGRVPFMGKHRKDREGLKRAILKGKVGFSGKEWDGVSQEAKDLVQHMLAVDPRCGMLWLRLRSTDLFSHKWCEPLHQEPAALHHAPEGQQVGQLEVEERTEPSTVPMPCAEVPNAPPLPMNKAKGSTPQQRSSMSVGAAVMTVAGAVQATNLSGAWREERAPTFNAEKQVVHDEKQTGKVLSGVRMSNNVDDFPQARVGRRRAGVLRRFLSKLHILHV